MRTVLSILIGPYVMGAKLLSERVVQFTRTNVKKPRGQWTLFVVALITLSAAAAAASSYLVATVYSMARCPVGYYCDPAKAHHVMQYAKYISQAINLSFFFIIVAIMIRIGLSLKLVDTLVWSKLNRVLTKRLAPHRPSFFNYHAATRLYWWCWTFIGLSIASSITVMALTFTVA